MMPALVAVVLWLLVGHAAAAGVFWGLLQVPESNAWMLSLSALLSVVLVALVGFVETGGVLRWVGTSRFGERLARAVRNIPASIVAMLVFSAVWWITGWLASQAGGHRGEIDAALMARFGWTKTAWVHTTIGWAIWFVRYTVGLSLALTLMVVGAVQGFGAVVRFRWLGRGLSPLRLVLVAAWLLILIWLPWQAVYWRPRSLPANWLEPVFVTVKLLVIYLTANIGWALVLWTVARGATPAAAPKPPDTP
jgi:hypothetical protein